MPGWKCVFKQVGITAGASFTRRLFGLGCKNPSSKGRGGGRGQAGGRRKTNCATLLSVSAYELISTCLDLFAAAKRFSGSLRRHSHHPRGGGWGGGTVILHPVNVKANVMK